MTASQTIEIAPASPGKHVVRAVSGLNEDWKRVIVQLENAEGETVRVELDQHQALAFAGSIQGYAFILR